ncbi:MAG: hypothetical protein JO160_08770 [Candidatus Eremiobacteraeota bacterium]|nr:hypothetical protein [Candidatus Eremiobacteraeota bacterium]
MHRASSARSILTTFVGVGDSLTAGYQAGGFLGDTNVKDPLVPGVLVRPGQENGFWADVDEMISGLPDATAIAKMYDPSTSPLPLIKGPGLNNQLVPAQPPTPFGLLKSGDACTDDHGFNAAGYLLSGLPVVRMNPTTKNIRDFGVPGITLHEANVLFEPQSDTCVPLPGVPGLLALIVDGESSTFWPVLGNYAGMGTGLSEARAAASVHPTLATVWLGANDLLKYMGSGGRFTGHDSGPQAREDLIQTIQTLQYAGAKTAVANLPDVLLTPYFLRVTIPHGMKICKVQTYAFCVLVGLGFPPNTAAPLVLKIATSYHLVAPGCVPASTTSPCGYLTLQGALGALQYYLANSNTLPDLDCTGANFTKPCVPGSGIGTYYITPPFAAKIQALNNDINTGIGSAATYTQSAFVDVRSIFDGISSGDPANPYFQFATSINPGTCCTLAASAGLVSFDGLHPSNTGYAMVAHYFIEAINQRYGTHIRQIDVRKVYKGTRCSNKLYCFADVYAPQVAGQALLVRDGNTIQFRYSDQY